MNDKILIANRGEIAVRILRACHELGLRCVVVYSEADKNSLTVRLADEAVCIGPAPASESYLRVDRILSAAVLTGATAVHPGYGFLAENAHFAELCTECGLTFIGPSAEAIRKMGNKTTARKLMTDVGVPVTPGSNDVLSGLQEAYDCAEKLGYPVILKAAAGGGGRGMRIVQCFKCMENAFKAAQSEAEKAFGNGTLFMEKFTLNPKHVEVQIFADNCGNVVHLGERDCSLQRHHQKLVEESPCIWLDDSLRNEICATAVKAAQAIGYRGVGTVEYLVDAEGHYYFMEMNTRIQVEHTVSEMVSGMDLVALQIRVALGDKIAVTQDMISLKGHAIEARINAEDAARDFSPMPGHISFYAAPGGPGVRMDSHIFAGYDVPPFYDSLLGKLIVHAPTRTEALARMRRALGELIIEGVPTTRDFTLRLLDSDLFIHGDYTTTTIESLLASQ